MKINSTTAAALPALALSSVGKAMEDVSAGFDRFCLAAGIEALSAMIEKDVEETRGRRHAQGEGRRTAGAARRGAMSALRRGCRRHDVPNFALMTGVPERRTGWMSKAGERLRANLIFPRDGGRSREVPGGRLEQIP